MVSIGHKLVRNACVHQVVHVVIISNSVSRCFRSTEQTEISALLLYSFLFVLHVCTCTYVCEEGLFVCVRVLPPHNSCPNEGYGDTRGRLRDRERERGDTDIIDCYSVDYITAVA